MRIIAGEFRSRRLLPPAGQTTRPIPDRVKGALFNTLTPWMPGSGVADLFCGTGSMGLESLSRGARHCWFAERDPSALERLERNLDALGAHQRATIWRGDIVRNLPAWMGTLPGPLDVAFLDPPYALAAEWVEQGILAQVLAPLAANLAADGVIVLRTPVALAMPADLGALEQARRKNYGSMTLHYLQNKESTAR